MNAAIERELMAASGYVRSRETIGDIEELRCGMNEIFEDVVRDIRGRAEVAGRQDEDATLHHSVVAAMLCDIADRIEAAYRRQAND